MRRWRPRARQLADKTLIRFGFPLRGAPSQSPWGTAGPIRLALLSGVVWGFRGFRVFWAFVFVRLWVFCFVLFCGFAGG